MRGVRRWAWIVPFVLALVIGLFAVGAIALGVDPTEFQQSTGMSWTMVAETTPSVARYLIRLERLIGVGYGVFCLTWAALAWFFVRRGDRRGWRLLWSMPVALLGAAVIFFLDAARGLGVYYASMAAIAVVGLVLSAPKTDSAGGTV